MSSLRDNLFHLARKNDAPGIEKLIIRDSGELDERDDNGLTAVHICATYGCVEACAILLKLGAKHSLQDFESGWTPLHRAFYFGNLKISLLLIRAGALIADDVEKRDWKTDVCPRRERWRSIRNLATWKPNIDHDGLSPLDLLSLSLGQNLKNSTRELQCTSVLSFGKADFTLGVPLPNSVVDVRRPRRIEPLSCESITQIVASRYHSVALTREGEVYTWGHGRAGRLGHGDENTQPEPRLLLKLGGVCVRMISAGENHTLAVTSGGDVFSWGSDRFGQLGYGGSDAGKGSFYPRKIENLKKAFVVAIAAGDTHSVCFTADGEIYSWGSNKEGQLGIPPSEIGAGIGGGPGISAPKRVYLRGSKKNTTNKSDNKFLFRASSSPLLQVAASRYTTLLLCRPEDYDQRTGSNSALNAGIASASTANEVYQWGHGSPYPTRVQFTRKLNPSMNSKEKDFKMDRFFSHRTAPIVNIVQLSAGLNHNVALSSIGHVYTWGLGSDQLGHGSHENRLSVPQLLETLLPENGGGRAIMVSAANDRTCVVSDVGDLYTWGATAEKGVLGHGSGSYQPIPKVVGGVKRAVSVAAGGDYTLVLTSAYVPEMPFSDIICNTVDGVSRNQNLHQNYGKVDKSGRGNIVVVMGSSIVSSTAVRSSEGEGRASDINKNDSSSDNESEDDYDDYEMNYSDGADISRGSTLCAPEVIPVGIFLTRPLSLQEICEKRICESVDTRNVVAFLAHAEAIGARALAGFCTQFIHRNLDAILVQSRLSDLDILIADLAFSDASTAGLRHTYNSSNNGSGNGNLNGSGKSQLSLVTNSVSSSTANIRQSQTRKLTRDDIEWHSRDSKYGETKERSHSGSGDTGSFHKLPEGFNVTWSSCKIDEKKSDTSNTMEDYGYGAYGDDMRGGRGRSHSKDLESLSGVTKSIRSVKKKIQSIDELEQRLRDGLIKELNEEQCEKVSRRESLQSELKRLTLICTRLEGEERVKSAAKVQREKAASELVTSSKSPEREPSEPPLITSVAFTEIIPKQLVVTAQSGQKSTKSSLRSRNNLISSPDDNTVAHTVGSVPALTSNSTSISKSVSTLASSSSASQLKHSDAEVISGCKNESSNSSASSASSVSKAFTPPSFNDWLKVTEPESISKATNISVPHKSTAIAMTPESTVKKGWGTVATFMDVSKENEAHPMRSVQIKKSSTTPIPSVLTTPIKGTFTPQSPAISTTGGKGPAPISLSKIAVEKDENTERQSVGISLADLMITPKKQNSKKNTDTPKSTREFASVDSTNLFSTPSKIVPSCPWLSPAAKSLQSGTPENSITNSSLKIKAKTFSEIQIEEETARLESNIHSLKGNDNPWYQERRKRADSIEEVIRSQAEEKIQEEENRKEEENAIREVELLKKREKREKMKLENTIQRAKSKSKAEGKQKADTGVASTGGELGAEADSGNAASAVVSKRRSDSSGGPAHRRSSVSEDAVVSDGKTPRGGKTGGRERGSGRGRGRGPVNPEATSCSSGTGTLELNPSSKPFVPAQSALSVSADTIATTDIPNAPPIGNNSHGRGQGRGGRGAGERGGRGGGANGGKKPNNENSTHNLKSDLSKCAQEGTVDKSDTILAHVEKRNRRGSNNIKSAGPSVIDPNLCERKVQIQP